MSAPVTSCAAAGSRLSYDIASTFDFSTTLASTCRPSIDSFFEPAFLWASSMSAWARERIASDLTVSTSEASSSSHVIVRRPPPSRVSFSPRLRITLPVDS